METAATYDIKSKVDFAVLTLKSLCRICLSSVEHALNLFSQEEECKEILDKLFKCFQITLIHDKNLPSAICKECIKELNIANNFRHKCFMFDERFSAMSKSINSNKNQFKGETVDEELNVDISNISQDSLNKVDETKFECNICNEFFRSDVLYKQHLRKHKSNQVGTITGCGSNRRYHCTECTYSTPHSQTLVNHIRRHNGERPYKCECGKAFTQSSSLTSHKKIHMSLKNYMCSECGRQFKHAHALKTHSQVHKTAQFQCTICNKKLKFRYSLQMHMLRHKNIKNYSCEECGNTFVSSCELVHHRKKHDDIKKIECHLCGYKTHTKKDLIIHLKRHAGDKSHKCDICKETFYSSGDVRRHKRVHTREKPFSCPLCVQRFTYSTSLNKHMLTVHNINYKWADFKRKGFKEPNKSIEIIK